MKKIIFGITGLTLGGAERVLVDISNKLVEKYDVTIFTIYANGELEKELSSKIHHISLYDYRYDSMQGMKKRITPLKVLLNKKKIFKQYIDNEEYFAQIAFLEGAITRIFSVKGKQNSTKIAWIHNDISKVFGRGIKSKLKRILDRNIYEKYDTLAFVSMDNLDKFNKLYDDMDLPHETVINNYINSDRILKLAEEKAENEIPINNELEKINVLKDKTDEKNIQKTNNINHNQESITEIEFRKTDVNLVQVSRLVEQKAIDRLINVHTKLIKEGNNHKIFIIGDGPLKEKLEKQIQENGVTQTFILLGAKQNPYPYVKKADYLCLFSNFEGYPMVIEEAKILRKFILATNTSAREVLINYPYSQLVDNSEEGIEKAIKFAIENKKRISKIDNKYVYDNDKIINKIEKIIEANQKHPDRTGKLPM